MSASGERARLARGVLAARLGVEVESVEFRYWRNERRDEMVVQVGDDKYVVAMLDGVGTRAFRYNDEKRDTKLGRFGRNSRYC